ncbi:MAG: hypothetical protein ACK2UK_20885 [Candidatus Promineifilaceae bacterium]
MSIASPRPFRPHTIARRLPARFSITAPHQYAETRPPAAQLVAFSSTNSLLTPGPTMIDPPDHT